MKNNQTLPPPRPLPPPPPPKDWLSRFPEEIQSQIISYCNPYQDFFKKKIIKKDEIRKQAWKHYFFYRVRDKYEKIVVYYLLCSWGILKNPQIRCSVDVKEQCEYFPTDLQFNFGKQKEGEIDVYAYLYVRFSRFCSSHIVFTGKILCKNQIESYWKNVIQDGGMSKYIPVYDCYESGQSLYSFIGWGTRIDMTGGESTGIHSYPYPY